MHFKKFFYSIEKHSGLVVVSVKDEPVSQFVPV